MQKRVLPRLKELEALRYMRQTQDYQTRAAQFNLYTQDKAYWVTATPQVRQRELNKLVKQLQEQQVQLGTQDQEINRYFNKQIGLLVQEAKRPEVTDVALNQAFVFEQLIDALQEVFWNNRDKENRRNQAWQEKLEDLQKPGPVLELLDETQVARQALRDQLDQECWAGLVLGTGLTQARSDFEDIRGVEIDLLYLYDVMVTRCLEGGTYEQQQDALKQWYQSAIREYTEIISDPELSLEEKAVQVQQVREEAISNIQVAADPAANELLEDSPANNVYQGAY